MDQLDDPSRAGELLRRRAAIAPGPWTWLRQVHGATVVTVTEPGEHAGVEADAAVTVVPGAVLAVHTADCAPVLLESVAGDQVVGVGVVHAGWRGLASGVLEAAAMAMHDLGAPATRAVLGPCIRPRCYEFGDTDLQALEDRYGPTVRSTTGWGTPALDVPAGVTVALGRLDIPLSDDGTCTACSPVHHSFRARREPGRQALVAWVEP